ncbi:MAG: cyclic nucleotide-binding domain-containing protein [Desulfatibacillaceae bacterium]
MKGDLAFLSLAEVLQVLGSNAASGTLRIFSPHVEDLGFIKFEDGYPMDAGAPGKTGIDAVYALFGWVEGNFEFAEGAFKGKRTVQSSLMEIVMDGVRMLDEGEISRVGPETSGAKAKKGQDERERNAGVPVIKRQISNYNYVVDEDEFMDGDSIVREGRHGGWICVLLEGYADILRDTDKGPLAVSRIGPGAIVGNISSVLGLKSKRTASVEAVGDVVLGVLDLQRIHTEFSCISYELRRLSMSLDKRLVEVTNRVVEAKTGNLQPEDFVKDRKKVVEQGSEAEGLRRITGGTATIVRKTRYGAMPLATLGKDDFIGRIPFMNIDHEPHSAFVLGSEDLEMADMDLEALKKEYDEVPGVVKSIIEYVATCVSVTTVMACDPKHNPYLANKAGQSGGQAQAKAAAQATGKPQAQ